MYIYTFQQVQHANSGLGLVVIAVIVSAANLFIYCYFGKIATESFEKMSDCLYESNWQAFPVGLQKYIQLMIQNAQKSVFYHGFGMVNLDLMTFTEVKQFFGITDKKLIDFTVSVYLAAEDRC